MDYNLKEVVAELTNACNLRCIHCGSDCKKGHPEELNFFQWYKIIDDLAEMKVEKIVYSGGEPTLKLGAEELFAYTLGAGIKYGLISNGLNLSNDLIEFLKDYPPFAVGISLDGNQETHNFIRQNPISWQKAIDSITRLKSAGLPVCVITTINKLNYKELLHLAVIFDMLSFNIDSWQIQLAIPFGRMHKREELLITEEEFQDVCMLVNLLRQKYPNTRIEAADCFGMAPAGILREYDWNGCGAGVCSIGIDATGKVMPCLSLRNSLCGNAIEDSIQNIWQNSTQLNQLRNFDKKCAGKLCANCEYLIECRGGCMSQSQAYFNEFYNSPFCFYRSFKNNLK